MIAMKFINNIRTYIKRRFRKDYSKVNFYEILAKKSPIAKLIKNNYILIKDYPYAVSKESVDSFHPNGNVGCIKAHDEYAFGIRCDHLIWIEGEIENMRCQKAILLIGNHKGVECCNIILEKL